MKSIGVIDSDKINTAMVMYDILFISMTYIGLVINESCGSYEKVIEALW
tara:strand:+ start:711 stop:857 length:147 start_codon:yes stop_codon:yes gene_type:complete